MQEIIVDKDTLITSKTDLKGFITYANDDFVKYSGYSMKELLHKNHNIIRHPDMPRVAFKILWDYMHAGREYFGFVKNRNKTGAFYWVFANITPSYDESGNVIGYYSVRRSPNRKVLELMSSLYKTLREIESKSGMQEALKAVDGVVAQYKMSSYNELVFRLQEDSLQEDGTKE